MENKKRALGRGLEQLFNNENLDVAKLEQTIYETATNEEIIDIELSELRANPYQPRKVFDDEALKELSASIKEHGVFQPIIIKKSIKGYEIIAGERRVRASKLAGLDKIPAIIRDFTDEQMMEIALLENLQRENLTAIEEAYAYKAMIEKLSLTQDELSKKVGKSRSHLTNILGLLRLPKEVQQMIAESKLSMGHARALSKLEDEEKIKELANKIVNEKISVRNAEELTNQETHTHEIKKTPREKSNNEYKYVEDLLREKLDAKVKIKDKKIVINFTSTADLNRILEIIDIKE
ncbi:MAG: ParB/RepB/Spo0J family partition protein [Bacilli bacterium]